MINLDKKLEEKIEEFTNLISQKGIFKEIYPDIQISDFMDDGYNSQFPKYIYLNDELIEKKKIYLNQFDNKFGYSSKQLLAVYYYYVLCHEGTHALHDTMNKDLHNEEEEHEADDNAVELTINRFNDVFLLYLAVLLCNKVDREIQEENIRINNVPQSEIEKDTHYTDEELLSVIESYGSFTPEQKKIIASI